MRKVLRWLWMLMPARWRRGLEGRFRGVSRPELVGYAVWSAMGLVVAIPEIWAAVSGSGFWWPTISTTIGHLEDRWPVVALIPVALIVMSAYSVFRVRIGTAAAQPTSDTMVVRTQEGRLMKQEFGSFEELDRDPTRPGELAAKPFPVGPYFALAAVVVVVTALVASRSDNRFLVGYVLYSTIAIFWLVIPNVAAYWFKRDVQFTTVFVTVGWLGRRLPFVAALVAALLVILLLHLAFYPWPTVR